ncbi:conserved hypothetical protein [Leishmania major strain Friedlin]|uniref:Uncharacterized protein n=1 Tax=Leishmania major TaxID=5664 RepID=Q4QGY4_LEIMA|nr:conserved hypothetical protein [Leishmania major strain Friedlin]CAG9570251.1 hypothetical_protein_-_conserved [Leishmania major strain Friedlin]CAJ02864.1 conserved hypothetical protein [Leishmania major strain Friedlin]|eukprot:XP_001681564.1 conserved hypothetical protein [Leishmania major strain Friedlin]
MSAASSSVGHVRGSASSVASNSTEGGFGTGAGGGADAERRPPPRLRYFFECFVPDEDATDAQSLSEVWRHMEPLNPFHYRELWCGVDGAVAASTTAAGPGWVKPETPVEWNAFTDGDRATDGSASKVEDSAVKKEAQDGALPCSPARVTGGVLTTRAAQNALRTLRAVGIPDELSCMVMLSVRIPPGARLTRKQEKVLRLRVQRRPAPPRPIRRGAKVFVPVPAVLGSAAENGVPVGSTRGGGGLLDVTALGPRVMRLAPAGFADAAAGVGSAGYSKVPSAVSVMGEFAFDDDDEDEKYFHSGRRAGMKRSRHDVEDERLDDGDVPLINSGRWGLDDSAGGGVGGSVGATAAAGAAGGAVTAQGDEVEEDHDEEDVFSTGMVDDDDDENMGSEDNAQEDGDSFGGGDDGDDSL